MQENNRAAGENYSKNNMFLVTNKKLCQSVDGIEGIILIVSAFLLNYTFPDTYVTRFVVLSVLLSLITNAPQNIR